MILKFEKSIFKTSIIIIKEKYTKNYYIKQKNKLKGKKKLSITV